MTTFQIDAYMEDIKTVAISGHIRPDGDCIGSCMGMALYLRKRYPSVQVDVFLEEVPDAFSFIKDSALINTSYETKVESYDLFIVLDAAKQRIGKAEPIFDRAKKTINIDHHISNEGSAQINYVVPDASSTCELIYDVIDASFLDADIAATIYTGMVTDTGVFKYSSTAPKTMRTAAALIEHGFDFGKIIDGVFFEKTFLQQQLLAYTLAHARLLFDGRCMVSYLSKEVLTSFGAKNADLEGIVSQMLLTKGVHVSLFSYALSETENKVSLRSDELVDVAQIAQSIPGGGGHIRAAGCNLTGSFDSILDRIGPMIEEQLNAAGSP